MLLENYLQRLFSFEKCAIHFIVDFLCALAC